MSVRTPKFGNWKSCRDCPTLVLSSSNRSRCEPCKAAHKAKARTPRRRSVQVVGGAEECPDAIERAFDAGLAIIKRTPRADPLLRWESPLARL